jgi:hypothetical protein
VPLVRQFAAWVGRTITIMRDRPDLAKGTYFVKHCQGWVDATNGTTQFFIELTLLPMVA